MHRPIHNRSRLFAGRHLGPLGLVLASLGVLALAACHKGNEESQNPAAVQAHGDNVIVPTNAPQHASLDIAVAEPVKKANTHLTGRLVWDEDTTVRVFCSVAGRVNQIPTNAGQQVSAGETLATMYSPDFGQAQADANKAEADLKLSERTLNRLRDLFEHGAAAQKDVEAAEDDFENKKAERARSFARLSLYGVEAATVDGMFPLKAPLAGVIVEKNINPGQEVRPDQMLANDAKLVSPLFVISTPSRLSVLIDATESDIAVLRPGLPLQVRTRAFPDRVFEGKLSYISQSLDPITHAVRVRGDVENPDGALKAEMYVSVDVATNGAEGSPSMGAPVVNDDQPSHARPVTPPVEIPAKAVFLKDNQHFVFVEKSPGKYARQSVEVGSEHEGRVSVTGGLTAGERVVAEGSLLLQVVSEDAKD